MGVTRREFVALAAAAGLAKAVRAEGAAGPLFLPEIDSLARYTPPQWFRDAKLGIWACWGPEAVPEQGDWYARNMYVEGHPQYEHHLKTYGHPSKVGYKDLVPMWRGENWQPQRLMALYKKAGAKYFCAIAQHHDNIDCWNSKYHAWNSVKMGPKRDVIGEWRKAARAAGLRFGVTEHLGASWDWWGVSHRADTKGPMAGVPYDGADPAFASLYHSGDAAADWTQWYRNAPEDFQQEWLKRITDLLDSHQPDLLYSDGSLPFGAYGRQMLAHFYNSNAKRHGGAVEAVYFCKNNPDGGQYRDGIAVRDIERGVAEGTLPYVWQTDTCVGDWYYKRDIVYKTPTTVVQMLVDIVSKNGCLLLNLPLRGDGTLDAKEEAILAELGTWMGANGEGIYATRPWRVFGEGRSGPKAGNFNEDKLSYTAEDIRFTAKGGDLYAFALAWPENGEVLIRSLAGSRPVLVAALDGGKALPFTAAPEGLRVTVGQRSAVVPVCGLRVTGLVS